MKAHDHPVPSAPSEFTQLLELDECAIQHAHDHFRALRVAGPVAWVEELLAYAVTGYDEAVEVLGDHERFSSQLGDPKGPLINSRLAEAQGRLASRSEEFHELVAVLEPDWRHPPCLLTADPPLHTRQRQVVNRLFTPRRVAVMEPRIREIAEELVDAFASRGDVDLVAAFAVPLPMTVIAEQLGVGTDRLADFKRWSDHFVAPIGNDRLSEDDILEITRSSVEFTRYFLDLLDERRRDAARRLSDAAERDRRSRGGRQEASRLSYIAQLLGAGNETSTKMIAAGAAILGTRPRRRRRAARDARTDPGVRRRSPAPVDPRPGPLPHRAPRHGARRLSDPGRVAPRRLVRGREPRP